MNPSGAGRRRILMVGLDGAEPSLVFDAWRPDLPTLASLIERGVHGPLESTIPAITVPAWASMLTGRDPGQLGIYGFRNRTDTSYEKLSIVNATAVRHPRVWDIASQAGQRVGVVSVPPSYPPRPVNGHVVGCFLTPGPQSAFTYPTTLKSEVAGWIDGEFLVDVPQFRSEDKQRILDDTYRMAGQHFEICRRLLSRERYDFFMTVDMGVDRVHHAFWKYMDPSHPKHEPGHPLARAIHDYYVWVDGQLGELLALVPDDTVVVVASDHGGKAMAGGICTNEWLIEQRLLSVRDYPVAPTPFDQCAVAWEDTRAWGDGGYYARIFLNVEGREPEGVIGQGAYERERDALAERIEALRDDRGRPLRSRAHKPQEIYHEVRGIAPDLIVYYGDLEWRSVGSIGLRSIWTFENDIGPDDANHSQEGIFVLYDPANPGGGRRLEGLQIYDVAPTLLAMMGLRVPDGIRGRAIALDG